MVTQLIESFSGSLGELLTEMLRAHWPTLLVIGLISILGRILRRPSVKGKVGEMKVDLLTLRKLDKRLYTAFHDLYLPRPDGKGTTQIDHVVTSPFGIFVIETKNMTGWIFGDEESRWWTQSIYGKKSRFQNPLHQNSLHLRALAKALEVPHEQFHNLVFFVGDTTLKTELPPCVAEGGFLSLIRSYQTSLLSVDRLKKINEMLEAGQSGMDRKRAQKEHVANLAARR